MRISDWSSDVCSSDLTIGDGERKRIMGRSIWVLAVALGVTLGACRAMVPPVPPSAADAPPPEATGTWRATATDADKRSEEHTSELQSLMRISYAVFCLTKQNIYSQKNSTQHN